MFHFIKFIPKVLMPRWKRWGIFLTLNNHMKSIDDEITDMRLTALELTIKDLYQENDILKAIVVDNMAQEFKLETIINQMSVQLAQLECEFAKMYGNFSTND